MAWNAQKGSADSIEQAIKTFEKNELMDAADTCKGVIIENSSSYQLEYVNSGIHAGYAMKPVLGMFHNVNGAYVIPPNHSAGVVYHVHRGGNFGKWMGDIFSLGIAAAVEQVHVNAYISLKVRTPGKNHIVALGFSQGRNRCDKAGVEIRGEDGILDGNGDVAGHGTDATGNVTDITKLSFSVPFQKIFEERNGIAWHEFHKESRVLKIRCRQNNEWRGRAIFRFTDGQQR